MSKEIWKYPIGEISNSITLSLPKDAEVLCVQIQHEMPCIWVLGEANNVMEDRYFLLYGTGHPIENIGQYIGTFQVLNGRFVYHLFEQENE